MAKISEVEVKSEKKKEEALSLKPIIRTGWLPKGHDGEFQFTGCETWLVPPKNSQTGQRITGLTEEDERRLELKMRLAPGTLNKYNDDFWSGYKIKIPKEGRILFLENPKDELDILVLKANPKVANSAMEVADSPGASHYLTSVEKEAEVSNVKDRSERVAIKKYGQLSTQDMIDTLRVYSLLSGKASAKITKSTPVDLIESTLYNKLKEDSEEFMRIVEDPSFKTKVLIDNLVAKKILLRSGSKYLVYGTSDALGSTLQDTIDYLENPHNQSVLIEMKSKLEASE